MVKNQPAGLAVSAPVAHGGDPQDQKKFGLGGRCDVSEAPLTEAVESPYQ
ncbi:MAG: hypothetical protein QNJ68_10715 [Microcoleaceae cyanobacterium MO_207.B10]|nr:hypothetical protein [Microcoleaceae cyanobacterium MO_207.B10]